MFELLKTDAHTKARLGKLTTAHGVVDTPVFMPVGTQASVKALDPRELLDCRTTKKNLDCKKGVQDAVHCHDQASGTL